MPDPGQRFFAKEKLFMKKTARAMIYGALALGFAACAAQQKTSAEPEVAKKVEKKDEAPEVDNSKVAIEAHALVGEEAPKFSAIYFEYDSDSLKPESTEELKRLADYLNATGNASVTLTVEGHCDERGTPEYNMALGDRRARAASEYLA